MFGLVFVVLTSKNVRTVLSVLAAQMQESQQTPAVWSQGTAESRPQVMTLQRGPSHSSKLHTTQELGSQVVSYH